MSPARRWLGSLDRKHPFGICGEVPVGAPAGTSVCLPFRRLRPPSRSRVFEGGFPGLPHTRRGHDSLWR